MGSRLRQRRDDFHDERTLERHRPDPQRGVPCVHPAVGGHPVAAVLGPHIESSADAIGVGMKRQLRWRQLAARHRLGVCHDDRWRNDQGRFDEPGCGIEVADVEVGPLLRRGDAEIEMEKGAKLRGCKGNVRDDRGDDARGAERVGTQRTGDGDEGEAPHPRSTVTRGLGAGDAVDEVLQHPQRLRRQ